MMQTLAIGMSRQLRIVSALTIREVRLRNSKYAFRHFFDLMESVLYIIGMSIFFTFMHRTLVIGDSLLLFIATGVFPILYFRTISVRTAASIETSRSVTVIPFIEPIDYAISKSFVEFLSFIITFIFFFAMIHILGWSRYAIPYDMGRMLQATILITVFAFGVGLCNSFLIYIFPLWKMIWGIFSRVQLFFAGIFFIPEHMAPAIKNLVAYNPLMHMVALFRTGFYPTYPTHLLSVNYALCWTLGAVLVGLASERTLRNRRAHT